MDGLDDLTPEELCIVRFLERNPDYIGKSGDEIAKGVVLEAIQNTRFAEDKYKQDLLNVIGGMTEGI